MGKGRNDFEFDGRAWQAWAGAFSLHSPALRSRFPSVPVTLTVTALLLASPPCVATLQVMVSDETFQRCRNEFKWEKPQMVDIGHSFGERRTHILIREKTEAERKIRKGLSRGMSARSVRPMMRRGSV